MTPEAPAAPQGESRPRRAAAALSGPAAIVAAVVIVLIEYATAVPVAGDIPDLWLPVFCDLGATLRSGTLPLWDPHILGGAPLAADPQPFGWLYLLPMTLFTVLPCGIAMTVMIWAQPIIAGLACYAFVRLEGGSRVAATVGGLVLAVSIAGSELFLSLPISAAVGLAMLLLASLSWLLQASSWASRILRSLGVALVFSQIVAAHMSVGMLAVPLAAAFVLAKAAARRAEGWRQLLPWVRTLLVAGLACLLVSAGLLLPRLMYVPDSILGIGYQELFEIQSDLADNAPQDAAIYVRSHTAPLQWPLEYGTGPGSYLGAAGLLLAGAALWSRRRRALVVAMSAFGVLSMLLPWTATADAVAALPRSGLVDFYLHQPHRLGYHLLISIAVLAAVGVETWMAAATTRRRMLLLAPGTVALAVAVTVKGGQTATWLAVIGWVVALAVLVLAVRKPAAVAVAVLVGVELVVTSATLGALAPDGRGTEVPLLVEHALGYPRIPTRDLVRPGPMARALMDGDGRYASVDLEREPLYMHGANLYGLESTDGYSSAQPQRFWLFLRAATGGYVHYNRAFLPRPPEPGAVFVELLDVTRVVTPAGGEVDGARSVFSDGRHELHVLDRPAERASLITSWHVVGDREAALEEVVDPQFDPRGTVILEDEPAFGEPTAVQGPDTVEFSWIDSRTARVEVTTREPAILLVRNSYDDGWEATVDGRPAAVLAADYAVQGIAVAPGTHTVELRFTDPWVIAGLWISVASIVGLLGAGLALRRRGQPGPDEVVGGADPGSLLSGRASLPG